MEWEEAVSFTGSGAPYIGQALDRLFAETQAVVVLFIRVSSFSGSKTTTTGGIPAGIPRVPEGEIGDFLHVASRCGGVPAGSRRRLMRSSGNYGLQVIPVLVTSAVTTPFAFTVM